MRTHRSLFALALLALAGCGASTPPAEHAERGKRSDAELRSAMSARASELDACWALQTADAAPVAAQLEVVVASSGWVTDARVNGVTAGPTRDCIVARVRDWSFPAATESTRVTLPLEPRRRAPGS